MEEMIDYLEKRDAAVASDKLQEKWHKPLYPGAPLTLLQTAFERLHSQVSGSSRDGASDIECRAQFELYQPKGSLYPKSLYQMKMV